MKTYSVEIYRSARHGQYGSNYMGIAVYTVEAKNVFFPKEEDGTVKKAIITK